MGSSCEANGHPTVGGLIWVRRRNGSWWPGQILGPDELPESCLVSRRSGTPVKLLGREDAYVDWYNLEKSKRVKAFRCGEYDECIEKAKVTVTSSCKKVVNHARREDAILQALELENSQLSKNNNLENTSQTGKTENMSNKLSGLDFISVSPHELSRTAASANTSLEGIRQQTPNDSEDDGTEGSKKRMRGLQSLGVARAISSFKEKGTRIVHVHDFLKKKNRPCQLTKVLKKTEMVTIPVMYEEHTVQNGSGSLNVKVWGKEYNELKGSISDSTGVVTNNTNANNCKQKEYENSSISELLEAEDSPGRLFDVPFVRDFLKKKNRSCQLTKVLKKTKMVTIPVMYEEHTVQNGSGSPIVKVWGKEYNELKGNFSDSTGVVTNNTNANNCKQKEYENSSISELLEAEDSPGRLFDVPFVREEKQTAGSSPVLLPETGQVGTRPLSGQSSLVETMLVGPDECRESGLISSVANISHIMDNGAPKWQRKGKRNSRNKSKTKTIQMFLTPDDVPREINNTVEVPGPQRLMFIHQSCSTVDPKYKQSDIAYKRTDARALYDVNIDFERLPYTSILSNSTGQPVTGYSLEVEVLNDAVSDLSLNSSECLCSSCELGGANKVNGDVEMVPEASKKHVSLNMK